jgi:hypothetical protein
MLRSLEASFLGASLAGAAHLPVHLSKRDPVVTR